MIGQKLIQIKTKITIDSYQKKFPYTMVFQNMRSTLKDFLDYLQC
jgi:hypothetical protein